MPGDHARSELAGTRFTDVRWVAETASTNADAMALARDGAPEGIVLVADHQTAGRGRRGRSWVAPPGSSLLVSVLLRPPAAAIELTTAAVAVAAATAVEDVAGVAPRLKWPNDLVWPGDGRGPDRKLAGVLAEADWPASAAHERGVVVAGIGLNVNWPADLPDDLADVAVACNWVAGREIDREALLIALLRRLDHRYGELVAGPEGQAPLVAEWRYRSATLGRRVRVELEAGELEGTAVDITPEVHLVVEDEAGARHTVAAGDVVHLR